jgi:hypothetical protein
MTTCKLCGRKVAQPTEEMHEKCRLIHTVRVRNTQIFQLEQELSSLRGNTETLVEVLNRFGFMRMYFLKRFGIDILPPPAIQTPGARIRR